MNTQVSPGYTNHIRVIIHEQDSTVSTITNGQSNTEQRHSPLSNHLPVFGHPSAPRSFTTQSLVLKEQEKNDRKNHITLFLS